MNSLCLGCHAARLPEAPASPVRALFGRELSPAETYRQYLRMLDFKEEDLEGLEGAVILAEGETGLGSSFTALTKMAYTDPVSNAPNMLAIQRKLDLALGEAILEQKHLCLCLIDGDDLKKYNNSDYAAGDDVIRKITSTLSSALRPNDFLVRWRMGDEFIIILPATTVDQASMVGERLRAAVEHASQGWLFPTSISMGISYYPKHGYTADQLLEAAEKALVKAKMGGKNRVITAP